MAEGDNRSSNLLAVETAGLEEQLQGWGEVMLMADKVLRWERAWFPPAIMGVVSLLFLIIYYLDPSVLSGVSCFVMFLCLADYLVPILAPRIFGSNKWSTTKKDQAENHAALSPVVLAWQRCGRISQIIQAVHGQGYIVAIVFLLSHTIPDNQNIKLAPWMLLPPNICFSPKTFLQHYELVNCCLANVKAINFPKHNSIKFLMKKEEQFE
ncbi:ADP-ribosylation factor-like 6 interacting protein 1 [Cricetulus griseus]